MYIPTNEDWHGLYLYTSSESTLSYIMPLVEPSQLHKIVVTQPNYRDHHPRPKIVLIGFSYSPALSSTQNWHFLDHIFLASPNLENEMRLNEPTCVDSENSPYKLLVTSFPSTLARSLRNQWSTVHLILHIYLIYRKPRELVTMRLSLS